MLKDSLVLQHWRYCEICKVDKLLFTARKKPSKLPLHYPFPSNVVGVTARRGRYTVWYTKLSMKIYGKKMFIDDWGHYLHKCLIHYPSSTLVYIPQFVMRNYITTNIGNIYTTVCVAKTLF